MTPALEITRRRFLALSGAAAACGATIPAFASPRDPYVRVGESVSFVGRWWGDERPPAFIGSEIVREIHSWDGVGYPVVTGAWIPGRSDRLTLHYDTDLANFNRELTQEFGTYYAPWGRRELRPFPNLHAWVRHRRLGEPPAVMRAHLARVLPRIVT